MNQTDVTWGDLIKPEVVSKGAEEWASSHKESFVISPLDRGLGRTLGNAMRRILLSSLQGVAVVSVKVDGIVHEFSSIPGVREDMTDFILNVKGMALSMQGTFEKRSMHLKAEGPCLVRAGMIEKGPEVDIVNKDLVLCTLDRGASLNVEFTVGRGRGYVPAELNREEGAPLGTISIDSVFTPVKRVAYKVDNTRVGQVTDYDRLLMEIETNGAISPREAVGLSGRILQDQLQVFTNFQVAPTTPVVAPRRVDEVMGINKNLLLRVEELELSVRSANCLKNDNIVYIGDLVTKTEMDMMHTPNFGRKSLNEIKSVLGSMGLTLGMDVADWPPENLEKLVKRTQDSF